MKKYLFGFMVAFYLVTISGIPVYLHYCGGELEEISYLTKVTSCCGEETEEEPTDDGCCKNENRVLLNASDFTFKVLTEVLPFKATLQLFHTLVAFNSVEQINISEEFSKAINSPPPRSQTDQLLSVTILRI